MNFRKYVSNEEDHFSRWLTAMVCGNNQTDKIIKFFQTNRALYGVPRRIHIEQETIFMSNEFEAFCNGEGIDIFKTMVNNHSATGCIDRTVASDKTSILIFAK